MKAHCEQNNLSLLAVIYTPRDTLSMNQHPQQPEYLTDHFLIAMPSLNDGGFSESVTYLCQHDEQGAMGIVINKSHPSMQMSDIFEQLSLSPTDETLREREVYQGGPVQPERGFILHKSDVTEADQQWEATLTVSNGVSLTSSKDIIEAIADGKGPDKWIMALGYAGWGGGQLEAEILRNSWLNNKADGGLIFDVPQEQRWQLAAGAMGVDLSLLSTEAGHC
jgi:putative transcriptional regulator